MVKIIIDPVKLGNLEVGWWRAHHEGDKGKLLELLVEYNVNFYGFSQDEAKDAIGDLIQGVKYHDTREWAKAIDSVSKFYLRVKEKTELSFDPEEIANPVAMPLQPSFVLPKVGLHQVCLYFYGFS